MMGPIVDHLGMPFSVCIAKIATRQQNDEYSHIVLCSFVANELASEHCSALLLDYLFLFFYVIGIET